MRRTRMTLVAVAPRSAGEEAPAQQRQPRRRRQMAICAGAAATVALAVPAMAGAANVAVLGDNATDEFLTGEGHATTLVTDAQLATPGFLDAYDAFVHTRDGGSFGNGLSPAAAAEVRSYAGRAVALNGDFADALPGSGDAPDAEVQRIVANAVDWAAQDNGVIGEFNGAVSLLDSNSSGFTPLGLLTGAAGPLGPVGSLSMDATPQGAGHPVLAGVALPRDPAGVEFGAEVSGADAQQVLAVYNNGNPAIIANDTCDVASNVGCWHFDEQPGSSTAVDSSGLANHGTYFGGPLLGVPGVQNTAVEMDGRNDHVRVPDAASLDVGDSFTLEGWIRRDTDGETHQLFNKGGKGFHLVTMSHYDGNQVWLRKAGNSTLARSAGGVPADGAFHHVVATKDGPGTTRIYIDGVEQAVEQVAPTKVIEDTSFPLYFSATSSGNVVDGALDEYAVYDEALTPAEVAERAGGGGAVASSSQTSSISRTAPSEHSGACPDVGSERSGLTGMHVRRLSCEDATTAARRGPKGLADHGLDCTITSESFGGPVVRITRACTGPNGRTLRYTTLS